MATESAYGPSYFGKAAQLRRAVSAQCPVSDRGALS